MACYSKDGLIPPATEQADRLVFVCFRILKRDETVLHLFQIHIAKKGIFVGLFPRSIEDQKTNEETRPKKKSIKKDQQ